MTTKESETAFREISGLVIEMHKDGAHELKISDAISYLGLNKRESKEFVRKIIDAYKNGVDLSKKPGFLDSNPAIREVVYLFGGIALVFIGSIILSVLLLIIDTIFKYIGLGTLGSILVHFGEKAAGALMGLAGTASANEKRSIGMFIGCWIGSGLYYWFLFSTL